jgi:hypothetical protein
MRLNRSRLKKFLRLGWPARAQLAEAVIYLAASRLALLFIPFNRLAPYLGVQQAQSPQTLAAPVHQAQAAQVGRAVKIMSRFVPWDSMCLAQALAARWMLNRRKLVSTLYLGVAYDENKKMLAHAWLRCGPVFVTGAPQHQKFTTVATFAPETPHD